MKCERFIGRKMVKNQTFGSSFSAIASSPTNKTDISIELNQIYQAHNNLNDYEKGSKFKGHPKRRENSDVIEVKLY